MTYREKIITRRVVKNFQILPFFGVRGYGAKAEDEIKADRLIEMAEEWLMDQKIILPTRKVLKRLVGTILNQSSQGWFSLIYQKITEKTKEHLDLLTLTSPEEPKSLFAELKDSPPAASIGSINIYIDLENLINLRIVKSIYQISHSIL